jgi:hypothetical protein
MPLIGVVGRDHPLAVAVATEIEGAYVKVRGKPRRKEIKPMGMCRTAVHAKHLRPACRPVIKVMQPQPSGLDKVFCVGSWLKTPFGPFDPIRDHLIAEIG